MNSQNQQIKLEDLGYSNFFETNRQALGLDGYPVARVIAEYKGIYRIKNTTSEYMAKITGKQMFDALSREDYPAVGDWVSITELDMNRAVIHGILPRKTILKRKYNNKFDSQVIASNIDMAFIVQSVDRDYNLNRFDRYLTIVDNGGIKPVIILNKIDLSTESELSMKISQIKHRFNNINVIPTSPMTNRGIDDVTECIVRGRTHCFIGSSGVGKSSIINKLLGGNVIKTDTISYHTSKGRHTTARREMYFLDNGGIVIDNPGMREIGIGDSTAGIENVFDDITTLSRNCKFRDCTHTHETGCAVQDAVKSGDVDEHKYLNFLKLKKETEYYDMTKLEKRRKDRSFGRFCKKALQQIEKYK